MDRNEIPSGRNCTIGYVIHGLLRHTGRNDLGTTQEQYDGMVHSNVWGKVEEGKKERVKRTGTTRRG